jgi:hypothetical protein
MMLHREDHTRPFDFTLNEDNVWHKTEWHFNMPDKTPDYKMPDKK